MGTELYSEFKQYDLLCIEHNDKIRKELETCLKKFFNNLYLASNCEDGYDLYLEYKPKVILSDIQTKNETSKKMIEKIRKKDFSTLIIISNANYDENFLKGLINLQINHFIFKGVEQNNLLLSIKKAFGDKLYENIVFQKNFYFDIKKRELIFNNEIIPLRKREKDFLLLLYKNRTSTTLYFEIEQELWSEKEMSKNALKTFINEFRKKLPYNFIETVFQEGYKLKLLKP